MTAPIYLDYNATPLPSPLEVVREMLPFLQLHFGNPSSSSILGRRNKEAIEKARMQVAGLTGAKPEEILFTSGGTESNNHAIRGAVFANSEKGKHIITSQTEHPAVIEVCKFLEKQGSNTLLPVDFLSEINPKTSQKTIRHDTVLVSIMHANNEVVPFSR